MAPATAAAIWAVVLPFATGTLNALPLMVTVTLPAPVAAPMISSGLGTVIGWATSATERKRVQTCAQSSFIHMTVVATLAMAPVTVTKFKLHVRIAVACVSAGGRQTGNTAVRGMLAIVT